MTEPLIISPCPFCEGPPVPWIASLLPTRGQAERQDYGDAGLYVEVYTWCHECGAHGPSDDRFIYTVGDYDQALIDAATVFNTRDARNRDLYDGGNEGKLNQIPRGDA